MNPQDEAEMGKMMWALVVLMVLGAVVAECVRAQPISEELFTSEAHLWLSRGVVAEGGFKSVDDHIAIGNVLARRHARLRKKVPGVPFVKMIRGYMAGMTEVPSGSLTPRQYRMRNLPSKMPSRDKEMRWILEEEGWDGVRAVTPEPFAWSLSKAMPWYLYIMHWERVLIRMRRWARGAFPDKCPMAEHWGGDMDRPPKHWVVVDCGDTNNTFYMVPR